ncbi:MAG TPA: DUF3618 domain-containing protein [Vicinamibacterales bacterium]|nr:DUF3618 domain-containing protein [Vicinamibacterales bacterium]
MGEDTNQIEREIRNKREHLGRNLDELGDRARELADWRTHYQNHAGTCLGMAFAAGAVLAMALVPRSSGDHDVTDHDNSHDPYRPRLAAAPSRRNGTLARVMHEADETWGHIADALLRTASAKAIQVVSELVPAVREHLEPQPPSNDHVH